MQLLSMKRLEPIDDGGGLNQDAEGCTQGFSSAPIGLAPGDYEALRQCRRALSNYRAR